MVLSCSLGNDPNRLRCISASALAQPVRRANSVSPPPAHYYHYYYRHLTPNRRRVPYLEEDVGRVVHAHDQRADPQHVVGVGEGDEEDGGEVVDEHDDEVL